MAEPVVSYVVNKLRDFLLQEAALLYGVRDEVEWLERELRGMMCFLRDADSKRKGNNEGVKNWVKDVRELAYDVEDVIETFVLEVGRPSSIHRCTSVVTSIIPRCKVGKKIKEIKARLREISDRRDRYGFVNLGENRGGETSFLDENIQARRRLSPHHYDDSTIVGLEKDKQMMLEQLLNAEKRLCVISIVGMGGLGKTTLAKKVYNSREVMAEFQSRAWVSVSQDFRVTDLLKKIIECFSGKEDTENMEEEDLKRRVAELLKNHGRYLIIMDDVWRKEVWERIATAFPDTRNGSRVIFTTRDVDVAKRADPSMPPYELQLLDKTESQKLFLKKAFLYEDIQAFPKHLEDVGEKLVSKCHGLPLALVVLGGFLSIREKNHHEWSRVLNSSDWQSTEGCRAILSLSYEDLPYELKPCFLYIGSFPEDSVIDTQRLIGLWMAEGFIPRRLQKTREETARDFLEELVQRSLVQVAERRRYDGMILEIRIHDLLRDLCLDEAREDGFFMVNNIQVDDASTSSDVMTARRWVLYGGKRLISSIEHKRCKNFHTLLGFRLKGKYLVISKAIGQVLDGFKLLRVIDIEIVATRSGRLSLYLALSLPSPIKYQERKRLPKEIMAMIHLRYLRWIIRGIVEFEREVIMPSIKNLSYLQTLYVPELTIKHKDSIDSLTDLRELRGIRAGTWIERDLPKLTNLRRLEINSVEASQWRVICKLLGKLDRLKELHLNGASDIAKLRFPTSLGLALVLSNNSFPPSLTKLELSNIMLEEDPMPILEKLSNLVDLSLRSAYGGESMSCSTGGFPQLLQMSLIKLPSFKKWRVEVGAMPNLTHLTINQCIKLKEFPEGLQHVTYLQELNLEGMPYEFKDRARENERQHLYKIQHVPSIFI